MARVALATCAEAPELTVDGEELGIAALRERDVAAEPVVWDDPQVRWSSYDLVVVRGTWDYPHRRDEFLGWAASVPQLANPAAVLRWNTDKRYLLEIAAAGIPIVPTTVVEDLAGMPLPEFGEFVVKPVVGSRSCGIGRFDGAFDQQQELVREHIAELDSEFLIQPYQGRVDTYGSTSLIYFNGTFSHAVRQTATIERALGGVPAPRTPRVTPRIPLDVEYQLADAAAVAMRDVLGEELADQLLYARFDMVPGIDGLPLLIGVELTEPAFFLGSTPAAAGRFADAVNSRLQRGELTTPPAVGRSAVGRVPAPRSALATGLVTRG